MASITTHVLDITRGTPAQGLALRLKKDGVVIAECITQENGRSPPIFFSRSHLDSGIYVLQFDVATYNSRQGARSFFPEVVIQFEVQNGEQDYHIPLLLSQFGYSTYRGC